MVRFHLAHRPCSRSGLVQTSDIWKWILNGDRRGVDWHGSEPALPVTHPTPRWVCVWCVSHSHLDCWVMHHLDESLRRLQLSERHCYWLRVNTQTDNSNANLQLSQKKQNIKPQTNYNPLRLETSYVSFCGWVFWDFSEKHNSYWAECTRPSFGVFLCLGAFFLFFGGFLRACPTEGLEISHTRPSHWRCTFWCVSCLYLFPYFVPGLGTQRMK